MITVEDYTKLTMEKGTEEAKTLLVTEILFAGTMAKQLFPHYEQCEIDRVKREIVSLLICHRSMVIANYLLERARGIPMAADGPGPVIP